MINGVSITRVIRENGLHQILVARWKKGYKENLEKVISGSDHPYKEQAKIAELERMVGWL